MNSAEVLADAFERVRDAVHPAVNGLRLDDLAARPDPKANSIGWLVWHLARIQDDHVAAAAGTEQAWTAEGWAGRFGLPFETDDTGYGHDPGQVGLVRAEADALLGYYDAVHRRTLDFVRRLSDDQLDEVIDERWDPPVTLGVRLVSVVADDLQHAGQAAYVRGLLQEQPG